MNITTDPGLILMLERQQHFVHQLDRIEHKIDQIPECKAASLMEQQINKSPPKNGGFTVAGAWFKDWKALAVWIVLAALATGHITLGDISKAIMRGW